MTTDGRTVQAQGYLMVAPQAGVAVLLRARPGPEVMGQTSR